MLLVELAQRLIVQKRIDAKDILCSIPLSAFFRCGNIFIQRTTVILGFINSFDTIIVTMNDSYIRFYDAIFSRHSLVSLNENFSIQLTNECSVLDGLLKMIFVKGIEYIGVSYEQENLSNMQILMGGNQIFHNCRTIKSRFAYSNHVAGYKYSDGTLFVSSSADAIFLYFVNINFERKEMQNEPKNNVYDPKVIIFKSCRNNTYWSSKNRETCSCEACLNTETPTQSNILNDNLTHPTIEQIIINPEKFGEEWLKHFYPNSVGCTYDLLNSEINIIGPSEDSIHVLITIGLEVLLKGSSRLLGALLSFHPWLGEMHTLKFVDLAYYTPEVRNNDTCSWLRFALDAYSDMIISSDPILRAHRDSLDILSNSHLFFKGQSLPIIRHPFLHIEIYNDESL